MKILNELRLQEGTKKSTLTQKQKDDAKAAGESITRDSSYIITAQEDLTRIAGLIGRLQDKGPPGWPMPTDVLPPDMKKIVEDLVKNADAITNVAEYLRIVWKTTLSNKSKNKSN